MADKQTPSRPPRGPRPASRTGGSQGETRNGAPKGGSRPAGAKSGASRAAGGKPGGFKSEGGFKAGGSRASGSKEGGFKPRGEGFKGKSAAGAGGDARTGEARPPRARTARPILQVPKAPALPPRAEPVETPAAAAPVEGAAPVAAAAPRKRPTNLSMPIWQYVRLMVELEEEAKKPRKRLLAIWQRWRSHWQEMDKRLEQLAKSDHGAYSTAMMKQQVEMGQMEPREAKEAELALRRVLSQMKSRLQAAQGSDPTYARDLNFEIAGIEETRKKLEAMS
ncbi:hypothetical protein [Radicibacter daui]|uniref:hypothetical protein n=1 Tax=Radicibacter daui TaxID=3064829 RepID=UPI0040469F69